MARGMKVPKGARLEMVKTGTIIGDNDDSNAGKPGRIELYQGFYSDGYKSDFERTPHRWLVLTVDGVREWTFRYSGRNYDEGMRQFTDCATAIREV